MLHTVRNILRLCGRQDVFLHKRFTQTRATNGMETPINNEKQNKTDFPQLLQLYKDKIMFNSYLESDKLELGYYKYHVKMTKKVKHAHTEQYVQKSLPPIPVSLKYYVDKDMLLKDVNEETITEPDQTFQLPFGTTTQATYNRDHAITKKTESQPNKTETEIFDRSDLGRWMTNYEYFDDSKMTSEDSDDEADDDNEWVKHYGTPDPTVGVSRVACGGCGALLHCSDPAIPGYLPSEIYRERDETELKTIECQRCHFLKQYNIALDVSVQPEEYEKLLQSIRNVKSLVLLMVDLLDFPCSIWPGIVDIIGTDRPIILVANKVDLLPGDSIGYLKRIKESLMAEVNKTVLSNANIKHVSLISAKTGYGVEDLISAMFKLWLYKGDVFLVGCTNVGKSSLFNALLQSDYCKSSASDIIKRATVSRWPGTTMNLLKFPINRPSGWKIQRRTQRLQSEAKLMATEKQIRQAQLTGYMPSETPALIGHIGRSFSPFHNVDDGRAIAEKQKMMVMDENHKLFAQSKWFYDTPGVLHPDQVLSLLSTEELLVTIPRELIRPQTYFLHKGSSIFIGGLARLDFVDCAEPCRFTVFCSDSLPITVTKTEDADEIYEKFVGTDLFAAPSGGEERLKNWPGLKCSEQLLEFGGEGPQWCCGDVMLSSVAWVAVTAKRRTVCKLRPWTPQARGIYKRYPSVLPYSINLKGRRIRDTPAYMIGKVFSDNE